MIRRVLDLADKLGIPYDTSRGPRAGWTWDGEKLALKGLSVTGVAHEVAHWLVATPAERKLPDFGLGSAPTSGFSLNHLDKVQQRRVVSLMRRRNPETVEGCASFLGLAIEAALGTRTWEESIYEHGWVSVTHSAWTSRNMPQRLDAYDCYAWRHDNTRPGLRMAFRRGLVDRKGRTSILPKAPLDPEWSKFWMTFQRAVLE